MQLEFAKAHYQISPEKNGSGPGLGEVPQIWGLPFNISATAEVSNFKFGAQLGFAKHQHKITRRRKGHVALDYGCSPNFGGFLQYLHNG